MSWREHVCSCFGITEELEQLQPGHTRGLLVFYAVFVGGILFGLYKVVFP